MSRIAPWMVGVKEREREAAKAEKAKTVFGVFPHSERPETGYVVRKGERLDSGAFYFPMPYQHKTPAYVSSSDKIAQKRADKMNEDY